MMAANVYFTPKVSDPHPVHITWMVMATRDDIYRVFVAVPDGVTDSEIGQFWASNMSIRSSPLSTCCCLYKYDEKPDVGKSKPSIISNFFES